MAALGLGCCEGFSLVVVSRDDALVVVCGLLIAVASIAETPRLASAGSVVVACGLSCSETCRIFQDQGSNPCPLRWQADSHPLDHQGSLVLRLLTDPLKSPPTDPSVTVCVLSLAVHRGVTRF